MGSRLQTVMSSGCSEKGETILTPSLLNHGLLQCFLKPVRAHLGLCLLGNACVIPCCMSDPLPSPLLPGPSPGTAAALLWDLPSSSLPI
jgi:hypothetical protein